MIVRYWWQITGGVNRRNLEGRVRDRGSRRVIVEVVVWEIWGEGGGVGLGTEKGGCNMIDENGMPNLS